MKSLHVQHPIHSHSCSVHIQNFVHIPFKRRPQCFKRQQTDPLSRRPEERREPLTAAKWRWRSFVNRRRILFRAWQTAEWRYMNCLHDHLCLHTDGCIPLASAFILRCYKCIRQNLMHLETAEALAYWVRHCSVSLVANNRVIICWFWSSCILNVASGNGVLHAGFEAVVCQLLPVKTAYCLLALRQMYSICCQWQRRIARWFWGSCILAVASNSSVLLAGFEASSCILAVANQNCFYCLLVLKRLCSICCQWQQHIACWLQSCSIQLSHTFAGFKTFPK